MADVSDNSMIRTFSAHTAMEWHEFLEKATAHFNKAHSDVHLGYRFGGNGESHKISQLSCEFDWNNAISIVRQKAMLARKRAVKWELQNMVSYVLLT